MALALGLALCAASLPAWADEHRPDGDHRRAYERHEFHGRDVRHFERRDMDMWRAGRWHRTWHDGRYGWWWFAGGAWYFYERPVYPYPPMVSETIYVAPAPVMVAPPPAPIMVAPPPAPVVVAPQPAPVVVAPSPAPAPPPPGPAPQQFWYYCDNPAGYYPYVANCSTAFRQVPVAPQGR